MGFVNYLIKTTMNDLDRGSRVHKGRNTKKRVHYGARAFF